MNPNTAATTNVSCEICGGGHHANECIYLMQESHDQINDISNNAFNNRLGNPYSNTYNLGWRNHPNFSWSNNQPQPSQNIPQNTRLPGFQQRNLNLPAKQNQLLLPPPTQKSNLEVMIENLVMSQKKQEEVIQQLATKIEQISVHNRMLENQIAQTASSSQRNVGKLPSQSEVNPREEVQVITLRSGKQLDMGAEKQVQTKKLEVESEKQKPSKAEELQTEGEPEKEKPYIPPPPYQPPLPFPQRVQASSSQQEPAMSSGFPTQTRTPPSQPEKKTSLEDMFMQFMQSQAASMRNLENQMGQIAAAIGNRQQGNLPGNTETNPKHFGKEQCNAITLRNGKELHETTHKPAEVEEFDQLQEDDREEQKVEENSYKKEGENTIVVEPNKAEIRPPPPFPQRLQKPKQDQQFKKFLDILKQLHINIPFVEALEQMPSYAKFMKDVLSKKRKLLANEIVTLSIEFSAIMQNKLPPKLKDPGKHQEELQKMNSKER